MIYLYGLIATPLIALLSLVTWARITAKGHDIWQTVVGAMLSIEIKLFTWSNFQVFTWSFRRYTARCFSDIL